MYIFQSEQVTTVHSDFTNTSLTYLSRQISIHWMTIQWIEIWRLKCMGCNTGTLHTPKPTNIAELKTALLSIWNDLPQEFTDKAILPKDFDRVLLQLADTLNTQFKYREGS